MDHRIYRVAHSLAGIRSARLCCKTSQAKQEDAIQSHQIAHLRCDSLPTAIERGMGPKSQSRTIMGSRLCTCPLRFPVSDYPCQEQPSGAQGSGEELSAARPNGTSSKDCPMAGGRWSTMTP